MSGRDRAGRQPRPDAGPDERRRAPSLRVGGTLLLALAAGGCSLAGGIEAPPPLPSPALTVEPVDLVESSGPVLIEPAPPVADEILATPMLRDPSFQEEVDRWVDYWGRSSSSWFPRYLDRMGMYVSEVDSALAANGMPASLRYLPVIESGYNPEAVSGASAVGMWQFMAGTARGLGIRVTPLLDERRHPTKSTGAALRFLADLHDDFGSWFLALAAYNSGPNRVRRILDRYAPLSPPSDSVFWRIRGHLPRETRDFVPKLFGAILVASKPQAYGYEPLELTPLQFDEVTVPDATTLDVVARAAEADESEILRLNPQLVRAITPADQAVVVRVPYGHGELFATNYAAIPEDERVSFVEHRVAQGETLSHIAVRYGVRVSDLEAANPSVRPRYLRVGTRLTVPIAVAARRGS